MQTPDPQFSKLVVWLNGAVPLALLIWDAWHGRLGANPVEFATRMTGVMALLFLLLSLAVTPVRKWTGANWLLRVRRSLGLYAFWYACLHLLIYAGFDKSFNFSSIAADTLKRRFIFVGMGTFLVLVPLAVTSTDRMIKRLGGKNWTRLHRLAYVAGMGGVLHFWMIVKADTRIPLIFAGVLAVLLGLRVVWVWFPPGKKAPAGA